MRKLAFLPLLLLAAACSTASAPAPVTPASRPPGVEVLAHRGGVPENTLSAFKGALGNPGVGAIELDLQMSKDGELFVIHDPSVDRTTDGFGDVRTLKAADLRKLKTPEGGGSELIPTLDEVAGLLAGAPGKRAFVEIKVPAGNGTVAKALQILRKHGVLERSVIISFETAPLLEARKLAPGVATGYVARTVTNEVLTFPGEYLLMRHTALDAGSMERLRATGKLIYAWTVNDRPRMAELLTLKVDGLISDDYAAAVGARDTK